MSEKCFKIVNNEEFGRHLVALREIKKGEIIINEPPLISGPAYNPDDSDNGLRYCISCFKNCIEHKVVCELCQMRPFCSEGCFKSKIHEENECRIIRERPELLNDINRDHKACMNFIILGRCLNYYAQSSEKGAQNLILELQSKWEQFQDIGVFHHMEKIFQKLSWDLFNTRTSISNENVQNIIEISKHCLGVMRNNAFSHFSSSVSLEGLYFLSSFMCHSCIPNTDRLFNTKTGNMVTIASHDIPKNDVISTSYISLLNNKLERQVELSRNWLFTCNCSRCLDTTENDSNLGSYKCVKCDEFTLRKINHQHFKFKCLKCNESISDTNDQAHSIEKVEKSKPSLQNPSLLEEWLEENESGQILHPNHSIFIQIKSYLAQLYGRETPDENMSTITDLKLEQKIDYCRQVIHVSDLVLPPHTRIYFLKGALLFELWSSLREKRQRHSSSQQDIDLDDSQIQIEVDNIALKAFQILKFSIPNTAQHLMATIYDKMQF